MDLSKLPPSVTSIKSNEIYEYVLAQREANKQVTVKFKTADQSVFTQDYSVYATIGEVKSILSTVFKQPVDIIQLAHEMKVLDNAKTLSEFEYSSDYKTLELALSSVDPDVFISAKHAYLDAVIPDIITVELKYDDGTVNYVTVEIENRTIFKPFIGGYLSKLTGIEYHHGFTQTGPRIASVENKTHRDTQTYTYRNRKNETLAHRGTQMATQTVYIPSLDDKILISQPYETADEREKRLDIEGKVRTIQRYYRAYRMRKAVKELSAEYRRRIQLEIDDDKAAKAEDELRRKKELIGKVFPRTKADFYMLYNMVENWKKAEIKRIQNMTCGAAKIAEMYILLEQEIQLLMNIEKQKDIVRRDREIRKELDFLKAISEPLSWNSDYKNIKVEMDTLETQAGRKYFDIYRNLTDKSLCLDDKLKVLLEVKDSLADDRSCEIAIELTQLIDRAALLMARGISNSHLEFLQKRIEAFMLKHLSSGTCCNGVGKRLTRVKEKLMENNLFFCQRCRKLKTHEEFNIDIHTKDLKVCKSCSWYDRTMEPWVNIQPYKYILKCIRREEIKLKSQSSIPYVLTEKDIHYIVTKIWHGHSSLSERDDVYKLRLARWFRDVDWSPWNCVLLTDEEAKTHMDIDDLKEIYDIRFFRHVFNKHALARRHYRKAIELENYFQSFGESDTRWNELIEHKDFVAVNSKEKIVAPCH